MRKTRGKAPKVIFEAARENRKEMTAAEEKLWDRLYFLHPLS